MNWLINCNKQDSTPQGVTLVMQFLHQTFPRIIALTIIKEVFFDSTQRTLQKSTTGQSAKTTGYEVPNPS